MTDIREPDIALELEEMRQRNEVAVIRLDAVRRRAKEIIQKCQPKAEPNEAA
jgi:hypothetical protein